MIETQEHKLTRRSAILACIAAVGGGAVFGQAGDVDPSQIFTNPTQGIFIDLNTITHLEVQRGKETLRITNDEIWKSLHVD